ncbi:glycosyltransferase family 2 protein [Brytella acorum]|uniref:glycosyltransferase family 2 protein n=1 Tax=Brytella acorum TaxID=2959299 RepID=UPI0025AE423C|nr:glycosyltransferase family 2 protein [Brytella acorum]MDF3624069.1 glycosyltransferase family 2 protein [Brytella acorum]
MAALMAHVKVLMMQKDEGENLSRWLSHYSNLFGMNNLTIMDNGSSDEFTLDLLRSAEGGGCKIIRGYDTQHDFQNKGGHFNNIIKSWDAECDYDFALPVDCDEIIAAFTDTGISRGSQDIHSVLDTLKNEQRALRLDMSLFNVPGRPEWFAPVRHFHKGFVAAKSLEGIDNGQHEPWTKFTRDYLGVRLTYLHYHNRPYTELIERTRSKLSDLMDIDNREELQRNLHSPKIPGSHLIEILLSTEEEYKRKYDGEIQIFVPTFSGSNFLTFKNNTFLWNAAAYLAANPDVVGYELCGLHHYLRHGYQEGRHLGK